MARTQTLKRKKTAKGSLAASFFDKIQEFFARRIVDSFAGICFASGVFLLLSLISYHHQDPSLNTASANEHIHNWMGLAGAWISDLLLQTIGAGAFLLAPLCIVWAYRVFMRQSIKPFWARLISMLAACVFASIALAQIPAGTWILHPNLGSSTGTLLLSNIIEWSQALKPGLSSMIFTVSAAVIALIAFCHAMALKKEEILKASQIVFWVFKTLILTFFFITKSFMDWIAHYNQKGYEKPEFSFPRLNLSVPQFPSFKNKKAPPPLQNSLGADSQIYHEMQPATSGAEYENISASDAIGASSAQTSGLRATKAGENIGQMSASKANIPVVSAQKSASPQISEKDTQQRFALSEAGEWDLPPLTLIQEAPAENTEQQMNDETLRKNAELLQNVLSDFNVQGEIVSIHPGPVVTLYELEPAPGIKTSRVISLADDIARSMSAVSVRIAVVPGRNVIGIEMPNKERQFVYMQELLASRLYEKTKAKLPLILGKDIGGQPILADLSKMPHLLVAGTTGSGKSVAVNTMILSLLYRLPPEKCRFIMIDPKMLELSAYDGIPHLLSPVVTEPGKAVVSLKWAVQEMEERYRSMSKLGVRNIEGYNTRLAQAKKKGEVIMHKVQTGFEPETGKPVYEEQALDLTELPYIVVIVDEFADLMLVAGKDVENAIQRLAQMARAAGIHLIMATQRPSVDVITGVIKANFPTRISFAVTSKIDSRTILGEGGAEQLLGMGDMLYMAPGGRITRVHGPFVSDQEVESVTDFLRSQGEPAYLESITEEGEFGDSEVMNALFSSGGNNGSQSSDQVDVLYDQAVAIVAREGKASTSFIQRHLQIGYNRAARIVEEMEKQGIISPANATGKREILIRDFSDV